MGRECGQDSAHADKTQKGRANQRPEFWAKFPR
jgi:hypothetical protein